MSKMILLLTLSILYSTVAAFAQPDQTLCKQLDSGGSLGFVVVVPAAASGGSNARAPSDEYTAKVGAVYDSPVDYWICISVDPLRLYTQTGSPGAVNIRTQTYSYPDTPKSPSPHVFLGPPPQNNYTSISTYQNFHGCPDKTDPQLETEFHTVVDGRPTVSYPGRRRFLFTRDVKEQCSKLKALAGFFGGLIPNPVGSALAQTFTSADAIDPGIIVERRSLILTVASQPAGTQYMQLKLARLGKGQCVRIEASRVFADPSDFPQTLGFACVGK
jgi:hypothetical protein